MNDQDNLDTDRLAEQNPYGLPNAELAHPPRRHPEAFPRLSPEEEEKEQRLVEEFLTVDFDEERSTRRKSTMSDDEKTPPDDLYHDDSLEDLDAALGAGSPAAPPDDHANAGSERPPGYSDEEWQDVQFYVELAAQLGRPYTPPHLRRRARAKSVEEW